MIAMQLLRPSQPPALQRLEALADLDDGARGILMAEMLRPRAFRVRQELLSEGRSMGEPLLLLSGWAARVRYLADGRRQFVSFILPGEIIGTNGQEGRPAPVTVTSLTPVSVCPLPQSARHAALETAYAVSRVLEEGYLYAQIVRLGRLSARERIVDLLLELLKRLTTSGLASGGVFQIPLTQEILADCLGLTSVHVNRMLQHARRTNDLTWVGREIRIHDPAALAGQLGRSRTN